MIRFAGQGLACRRGERLVFAGLDFSLEPGDALVLTGRNGSGKTSLLRLAAGLTPPAAGRLAWHDGPVADDPQRHRGRLHYVGHLDAVMNTVVISSSMISTDSGSKGFSAGKLNMVIFQGAHPALSIQ